MKIPTEQECLALMHKHNVPENIINHCKKVADVAMQISTKLNEKGEKINLPLLKAAALLHDIDKLQTIGDNVHNHGKITYEILKKETNNEELAKITMLHVSELAHKEEKVSFEAKILNYADARCKNTDIVTLDERWDDVYKRYPHLTQKGFEFILPRLKEIEKEIFNKLDINPSDIK